MGRGTNVPQTKHPNADAYPAGAAHRGGDPSTCLRCGARRVDKQIGLEESPRKYVANLTDVFHEVKRVLAPHGSCWVVIGDTFSDKQLQGIPWRLAFALQDTGWILRSECIWHKRNGLPEAVTDRPTQSHEHVFMFTKQKNYFFDQNAVREPHQSNALERTMNPRHGFGSGVGDSSQRTMHAVGAHPDGRNLRSVWSLVAEPSTDEHYASFPTALVRLCLLAGCPERVCKTCGQPNKFIIEGDWCGHDDWRPGVVLDCFLGSGTSALVARNHQRHAIGIELSEKYAELAARRLQQLSLLSG